MIIKPAGARPAAKKSAVVPVVIVLLVVVAIAAGAWWIFLRSTPEKAVTAFMEASKKKDVEAVKGTVSKASLTLINQLGSKFSLGQLSGSASDDSAKQEYTVGTATIDGDKAKVPVKVNSTRRRVA